MARNGRTTALSSFETVGLAPRIDAGEVLGLRGHYSRLQTAFAFSADRLARLFVQVPSISYLIFEV
jgi:hypothetical protein